MEPEYVYLDTPHVVLDTSAIYQDFDLTNRETALLLREAARGSFQVCVPEIVIQEMTFHCQEQLSKTRRDLDEAHRFLTRVLPRQVDPLYKRAELGRVARAYETELRRRLIERGVRILRIPRGVVAVRDLLWRERLKRRPFKPDGQGLRDALIWESILELCRREPRPIVLISGNARDFANTKRDGLHEDLIQDLANAGVFEANLHLSIAALNNSRAR